MIKSEDTIAQDPLDNVKALLSRSFIAIQAYLKKQEIS